MSKLAQIHTYPPSLAKSKIMVKTFSLYHTGPVTCNSYFRHFESRLTVKKKITITASFSQKETKTAPKGQYYFVYSIKDFPALVFSLQFKIILKVFWRLPKMSGVCKLRRNPKILPFIFLVKNIFFTVVSA